MSALLRDTDEDNCLSCSHLVEMLRRHHTVQSQAGRWRTCCLSRHWWQGELLEQSGKKKAEVVCGFLSSAHFLSAPAHLLSHMWCPGSAPHLPDAASHSDPGFCITSGGSRQGSHYEDHVTQISPAQAGGLLS